MSATSSNISPLIKQNGGFYNDVTDRIRMTPSHSISYVQYEQPTRIRYKYQTPSKAKYRYTIEQEGQSYRCCQWCKQWCTRKYPIFDFCDRIVSCPLLFYILSALFLLFLFAAIVTLFSLHPSINSSRRFYGIVSTISIVNRTKYIFGLDTLCNRLGIINHCLDLSTSTAISNIATTITLNRTSSRTSVSLILFFVCQFIFYFRQR